MYIVETWDNINELINRFWRLFIKSITQEKLSNIDATAKEVEEFFRDWIVIPAEFNKWVLGCFIKCFENIITITFWNTYYKP